ncbi:YidC/Oxa1 family membrane protein insertase [Streptococcus merionis]|uniref:Membrane protein insertase YidC n=1 Tax=Streptococcus merionis TaxID=400065 RepID=A0A239SWY2_9STRE|nr:YidC/Oxa1 family membrane protein insertase [Streptococcus merionis]SNU89846.1 membrane protein (preprotein translocase) oxaA 1 [Streptococcus merionis]
MKRTTKLTSLLIASILFLSACARTPVSQPPITSETPGLWNQFVYYFAEAVRFLSFGGSIGIGIILFTIIIRTVLLPLFKVQMASTRKMQDLQPQIKALREKYPSRDDMVLLNEETQRLYKEAGVRPMASMIPLFIQMPILIALFQALSRVEFLRTGHFLWLNLSQQDPYYILPVLAAIFTFLSSWLSNKAQIEKNGMMMVMTYAMPVMIFFFAVTASSGVALYWTVSNAYQVFQTLLLNNPFKIIAEREEKVRKEKERQAKIRRAQKKATKKRK